MGRARRFFSERRARVGGRVTRLVDAAELAARIAATGLVVSEYAPGVEPAPWRFPACFLTDARPTMGGMMAKLVPVDAYIRVSRVGGREGDRFLSTDLQRDSIKRVAEREGLQVVQWFEELDASGGDNARPKWNDAIRRVERGETQGIVCWNLSRFSRSVKDALTAIERIEAAGGKLYSEEGSLTKLDRGSTSPHR